MYIQTGVEQSDENRIVSKQYEIEDLILNDIIENGTYPNSMLFYFKDEITGYDEEINGDKYIDTEMVVDYIDGLGDEKINKCELYARADVMNPISRKGK